MWELLVEDLGAWEILLIFRLTWWNCGLYLGEQAEN